MNDGKIRKSLNCLVKEFIHNSTVKMYYDTGKNVYRVEALGDEAYQIEEFGLPKNNSRPMVVFKQDLPQHIADAIVVLSICEPLSEVTNLGKRLTDDIFYIEEKND